MNRLRIILFLVLSILADISFLLSQNDLRYYFKTLDIKDGLSQNTVNTILQDKKGFMWFGTKDGLNRFDGLFFRVFGKEGDGLGNSIITILFEDSVGNIWVGTDAGVYIYSPETETFEHLSIVSDTNTKVEKTVTAITSDEDGGVWVSVDSQGLFHYDPVHKRLKNYLFNGGKQAGVSNVTTFWFDKDGGCWLGLYDDNLYYSKDLFKTVVPFIAADGSQPFKDDIINCLVPGPYNCLYVGSAKGGLKEVNLSNHIVRDLLVKNEKHESVYVRDIVFYSENLLSVGTESGVYLYNIDDNCTTHLSMEEGNPYSLSDNAIYSLCKDREGGLWIGTYFGGLNYYPNQFTYFEKFYPQNNTNGLGRRVREFRESKYGTLWIGTEDKGLFNLNPRTGDITPFINSAIYHNIHGLCLDNNYLWVGTFSGGLNRIDLTNKSVKTYRKGAGVNTLNANDIFVIHRTRVGELWIGTTFGLLKYNRLTDDFIGIPEINGMFVYDIKEDYYGNLWLATYANGVFRYDVSKKKWKNYVYQDGVQGCLPYNKVLSIYEDTKKRIWFTTQGKGFCRYVPETDSFQEYDSSDGFPSDVVYQIIEDNDGLFWVTTNKGLVRFNSDTNDKKVFTIANGLLSDQFNYRSSYKDSKGRIYLGCIDGFISFDPSDFVENTFIPPVVITDFLLFNKPVLVGSNHSPLKKSITLADEMELAADQNSFSFRLAALSYQAPKMNKLMYKLDGFDREWYSAGQNSIVSYSNLPYGSYTFMVKGSNGDGLWNDQPTILKIHILPPFYLSMWAYILYIILVLSLSVYLIYYFKRRNRHRQQRMIEQIEQDKERELYTAKIDFFTNVTHEIRTPLTLIKSPLENVLREKTIDPELREDLLLMDKNANRLLDLTNQLLDFRKVESEGFRLSFEVCDISEVLREVHSRFLSLMRQKGLNVTVNLPDNDLITSVDREALTKVISNLLANAVKYAETFISVGLDSSNDGRTFRLTICNDGKIIPFDRREDIFKPFVQYKDGDKEIVSGTGIGLALSRSLAELHGGTLYMDNATDQNCFKLEIPVQQQQTITLTADVEAEDVKIVDELSFDGTGKPGYTILIVEDDPDMLSFIERQLLSSYNVCVATNGVKALDILSKNCINLVISDIMMPQMDGLELCDRLKSDVDFSHIPVILLTAKSTLQAKIEGLTFGADAYIEKPFSVEYLKVCVSNLLKNREKLRLAFANSPFISTSTMAMTKADEMFLKTLKNVVLTNMQNPDFSLDDMASLLNMSRSSLNRKIKGILDLTPNDYIRLERLKKAAELLKEGESRVNEICYIVGFNTPSYFTKCFQKQFGALPKDFARQNG